MYIYTCIYTCQYTGGVSYTLKIEVLGMGTNRKWGTTKKRWGGGGYSCKKMGSPRVSPYTK